jgi:hypothetical protein
MRPGRRIGLSPLSGRYLIVGTSFYYGTAGRDGVAATWAPKSTVGHRRITRNSRAHVQPGEVFLDSCPAEFREPRQLHHHRIKSPASCSVRRGGALRHSAQHINLVSLIYIQACGGLRGGEPPGVSHCTESAPNDQRILMCFRSLRTTTEGQPQPSIRQSSALTVSRHLSDWCCPISS